jgi:sodium pump decarboxylase gamma subunit
VAEIIERARELPWGYIFSTLFIRFIGVFLVLAILMIGMQFLGAVVSRLVAWQEAKKTRESEQQAALAEPLETQSREEEIAAAIGAAMALSMESVPSLQPLSDGAVANGSWALAGRMALMSGRLPAGSQRRLQ